MSAVPADITGYSGVDAETIRQQLTTATSISELTRIFQRAIAGLGHFLVAEINDPRNFPGDNLVFGTIDMEYLRTYWLEGDALHDPLVRVAINANRPVRFRDAVQELVCSAEDHRTLKQHAKRGLADGYAFPMKGRMNRYCNVSIHGPMPDAGLPPRRVAQLEIMAMALYRRAAELVPLPENAKWPGSSILTNRERECLNWVAQGKTNWEIAEIVGIAERTVQYHVDNACRKLEVPGRLQAVLRAAQLLEIML